jgi:D-inositol-3-phosphate glycosyltransferase
MDVVITCFVADPFDPPGHDRFGGGHLFLFDLGRYLVRMGDRVTYVTRLNSPLKPVHEEIGSRCAIHRLPVGPAEEISPAATGLLLEDLHQTCADTLRDVFARGPVVHSHYWIAGEVSRRIAAEHQLLHVHSFLSLGRVKRESGEPADAADRLRDECELRVFNAADHLVAVCPDEWRAFERLYPEVSPRTPAIIPYGVDPNVFYRRPESPDDFVRRAAGRFTEGDHDAPGCAGAAGRIHRCSAAPDLAGGGE